MSDANQQEQMVLDALAEKGELSAAELSREVSMGSARLYPLLAGLEHRGAVSSRLVQVPLDGGFSTKLRRYTLARIP